MDAPGVTVTEVNKLSLSVSAGPTAIPVFIGKFRLKGASDLIQTPTIETDAICYRVENWLDFTSRFGESAETLVIYPPPVVKAARATKKSKKATPAAKGAARDAATVVVEYTPNLGSSCVQHYFDNGGGPCYILPYHTYTSDAAAAWPSIIPRYPDISLLCLCEDETNDEKVAMYSALNPLLNSNQGYFLLADMPTDAFTPGTPLGQTAQYWPALETRYSPRPSDDYIYVSIDSADPVPFSSLSEFDERYQTVKEALDAEGLFPPAKYLPASPAMAGIYAKTDRERGVWKAPANVNISQVKALYYPGGDGNYPLVSSKPATLDKTSNEIINDRNRGIVVWGARTMEDSDLWRYIPVRRLFNSAERDIKETMRSAVFQPNTQATWESVRGSIANYLDQLWRKGGLMGESADQAYFVQVGKDITMTEEDILQGKMIVKVGMAAVRPAEYIILQFTQDVGSA